MKIKLISHMKGIDIRRDGSGKIQEIKFFPEANPDLVNDVWKLVKIRARQYEGFNTVLPQTSSNNKLSIKRFRELVRESKASGELTEKEFFQLTPTWSQKRER